MLILFSFCLYDFLWEVSCQTYCWSFEGYRSLFSLAVAEILVLSFSSLTKMWPEGIKKSAQALLGFFNLCIEVFILTNFGKLWAVICSCIILFLCSIFPLIVRLWLYRLHYDFLKFFFVQVSVMFSINLSVHSSCLLFLSVLNRSLEFLISGTIFFSSRMSICTLKNSFLKFFIL